MTFRHLIASFLALSVSTVVFADENHEILAKVMKEGFKGNDSPLAKVLDGDASSSDTKSLAKLVLEMKGTKAPKGEQNAYDEKLEVLFAAMNTVAGGDTSSGALEKLDNASNCKACHSDHKPKKN